ncbi:hypothetical protein BED46_036905 [Burkholderia contaminans]|nr:hypothetical protein BED46_036905 [Burkholderia contaminans]
MKCESCTRHAYIQQRSSLVAIEFLNISEDNHWRFHAFVCIYAAVVDYGLRRVRRFAKGKYRYFIDDSLQPSCTCSCIGAHRQHHNPVWAVSTAKLAETISEFQILVSLIPIEDWSNVHPLLGLKDTAVSWG